MIEGEQPAPVGLVARQHRVSRIFKPDRLVEIAQGMRPLGQGRLSPCEIDVGSTTVQERRFRLQGNSPAVLLDCVVWLTLLLVNRRQRGIRLESAAR